MRRYASSHASLAPVPRAPSPPRGLPLLLPRAGETVAAGAVPRLARAHAPMARPRRPSVPDRRPAPALEGKSGHGRQPPNPPLQSLAVLRSRFRVCQPCWFIPSQPPQGGAMNARAASALRSAVFRMPRPVVVGGRKGFCSRAIPGPGPSQNPALCGSPPAKCSSASASYWCEGGTPLGALALVRATCRLRHFRFGQRSWASWAFFVRL